MNRWQVLLAAGLLLAGSVGAQDEKELRALKAEFSRLIDEGGSARLLQHFAEPGRPTRRVALAWPVAQSFYNQDKDVTRLVATLEAGIAYLLVKGAEAKAADPKRSAELLGAAKTLAYNLGSNTWPGWKDEGIVIRPEHRAMGLRAARLNLRLAQDLERDAGPMSAAWWLLGAHQIAAGLHDDAIRSFGKQLELAKPGADSEMARGYIAIARILAGKKAEGRKELDAALKKLAGIGSDDAKFYARQLETALEVFSAGGKR